MDDFIIHGTSKEELKRLLERVRSFLKDRLKLDLHPNIQLNRCGRGVTFLGYRIFPGRMLLSQRSKKRFIWKLGRYEEKRESGAWCDQTLARHVEPLVEFTRHARAAGFRAGVMQRLGVLP